MKKNTDDRIAGKSLRALILSLCLLMLAVFSLSGCTGDVHVSRSWKLIVESAKHTQVNLIAVDAKERVKVWMEKNLRDHLQEEYQMDLNITYLTSEDYFSEVKKNASLYDAVYFGEEGFRRAYELGVLYGPFAEKLENFKILTTGYGVESGNGSIVYKEGRHGEYAFVPVGKTTLFFVYDDILFYDLPTDYLQMLKELSTVNGVMYPSPKKTKEGLLFLQGYVAENVDMRKFLDASERDLEQFRSQVRPLLKTLKDSMPYFDGTYEEYEIEFEDQNIIFFMSMDPLRAAEKMKSYEYPDSTSLFVMDHMGTTNSVAAIHAASENKAGAMVLINEMISPKMQAEKLQFGDQSIFTTKNDEKTLNVLKQIKRNRYTLKFSEFMDASTYEFDERLSGILVELWEEIVAK